MKTVIVKRVRDLAFDIPRTAADGVRVLIGEENVLGDDLDYFASFRNADYESTDGYAVMSLLRALQEHGAIKLKCDDDVRAHYFPSFK